MMERMVFLAAISFCLSSCNVKAEIEVEQLNVEFRANLSKNYFDLFSTCDTDNIDELRRSDAIEQKTLSDLKKPIEEVPLATDIALARQDFYFKKSRQPVWKCLKFGSRNTWPEFPIKSKGVQAKLALIKTWSNESKESNNVPAWVHATNAGELRGLAKDIYWSVSGAGCGSGYYGDTAFDEEGKKIDQLENSIAGTDYAYHFKIAKYDFENEVLAMGVVECQTSPKGQKLQDEINIVKKSLNKGLKRLEVIVENVAEEGT